MSTTFRALAMYSKQNNRLPNAAGSGGEGSSGIDQGADETHTTVGHVPYRTLFLEEQNVRDGSGQTLYYIVHPALTAWRALHPLAEEMNWEDIEPEGARIQVYSHNRCVTPESDSDYCAVVLIAIPINARYQLKDLVAIQGQTVRIQIPTDAPDIQVRWVSRNNLRPLYG